MKPINEYKVIADIPDYMVAEYQKSGILAVDTELHGLKLYRDEICLIQMCDDEGNLCLVKPEPKKPGKNLRTVMENKKIMKVFHFALTDVAFFRTSLGIEVKPFNCTKVMSKICRTYTEGHGLKDLSQELLGMQMEKQQQQTNWARTDLSPEQLKYAANDVLNLVKIYRSLEEMINSRPPLSTGATLKDLNAKAQSVLPNLIELLIHGYGNLDNGWQTSLFSH